MIRYLQYGLYLLTAMIGAIGLGLLFFEIVDKVTYLVIKLGSLLFGKGEK